MNLKYITNQICPISRIISNFKRRNYKGKEDHYLFNQKQKNPETKVNKISLSTFNKCKDSKVNGHERMKLNIISFIYFINY